jgi:hypothetical protein
LISYQLWQNNNNYVMFKVNSSTSTTSIYHTILNGIPVRKKYHII